MMMETKVTDTKSLTRRIKKYIISNGDEEHKHHLMVFFYSHW